MFLKICLLFMSKYLFWFWGEIWCVLWASSVRIWPGLMYYGMLHFWVYIYKSYVGHAVNFLSKITAWYYGCPVRAEVGQSLWAQTRRNSRNMSPISALLKLETETLCSDQIKITCEVNWRLQSPKIDPELNTGRFWVTPHGLEEPSPGLQKHRRCWRYSY